MELKFVTISVKDMAESVKFYVDVIGLTVAQSFSAGPDTEITFLGDGAAQVELIHHAGSETASFGQDISIGFETKSLEKLYENLKQAGVTITSPIISPNPHTSFFFMSDPNGVKIELIEHHD
jgi:lactoylglutathione lyase